MPLNEPNQTFSKVYARPILDGELPLSNDRIITYSPSCCSLPFEEKNAHELFDYVIDMMSWLEPSEEIIGAAGWCDPDSLVMTRLDYASTGVVAWLVGGGDNVRQTVNVQISTNLGRIKLVQFIVHTTGIADQFAIVTAQDAAVIVGVNEGEVVIPDPEPLISVYPSSYDFPNTSASIGQSSKTLVVKNDSDATAFIRHITMNGPFFQSNNGKSKLDPGEFVQLTITYRPQSLGEHTGALNIDIGEGLAQYATFTGTGISGNRMVAIGNQLVRTGGHNFRLKSVNWFGAESEVYAPHGLWSRNYKEVINQIAAMGFNCVRMPFSGDICNEERAVTTGVIDFGLNPDLADKTAIQVLDAIIGYMNEKGIYVVLDHHRRRAGDGADGSPVDTTYTLDDWQASWLFMVNRYSSLEFVLGADLHNEPHLLSWNSWALLAENVGNAILNVASHWLIFVEGVASHGTKSYWWGGELSGVADRPVRLSVDNRLVYSVHEYGISVGNQPWLAKDSTMPAQWPYNLYDVWREHWGFIVEQNIAPVWIGEVGGKFGVDGIGNITTDNNAQFERQWIYHLQRYMDGYFHGDETRELANDKAGISFAYWSLNPNSGDTGGLLQDDWTTEQIFKLRLISMMLNNITPSYLFGLSPLAWDQVNDNSQLVICQGGNDYAIKLTAFLDAARDRLYEPGEVHFFAEAVNPNERYVGQHWVRVPGAGKTIRLAAADDSDILAEGGSDSVTIAKANLPASALTVTGTAESINLGTKTTVANGGHSHTVGDQISGTGNWGRWDGPGEGRGTVTTSTDGTHTHDVALGSHSHTVSANTENMGSGTALNVTNQFVKLAAWYRVS